MADMTTSQPYQQKLTEMRDQLVAELETIAIHNEDTDDWEVILEANDTDDADNNLHADTSEDANMRRSLLADLETRYRNVVRALDKIRNGTYGICEVGGDQIETERLDANPAARTCTDHLDQESELPL